MSRLIDADKLLKTFKEECIGNCEDCKHQCFGDDTTYCELIVIAPTVDLRLMKTEECAGHSIEYAMGWKACIEWLKQGGDTQYFDKENEE